MSASLISQVETGKTQPSVSTLYALVTYLGMSFDDLMASRDGQVPSARLPIRADAAPGGPLARIGAGERLLVAGEPLQRSAENPVLEMENGVRWERLAGGGDGAVDSLLVTYEAGASSSIEGRMMRHSGVEYAYLLTGELTVRLDFDTFTFRPGDSLSFDSVRPHLYVNEGTVPAKGLWFVHGRREFSREMPRASAAELQSGTLGSAVDVLRALDRLA